MKKFLLSLAALVMMGTSAFAQKDITSTYIQNADFAETTNGWTKVGFNDPTKQANSGTAVEAYAGWGSLDMTEYSITQKITLPAGNYRLTGSAFFRQGGGATDNKTKSLAFLKAGEASKTITTLGSETVKAYANSQAEAAGVLSAGMYVNNLDFTIAEDGTEVEVGYVGTFDEMRSWCLVSGVKLYDMDQDPSNFDYTSKAVNPSFENGTAGWTITGEWSEQSNSEAVKVGTRYVEKWQQSGGLPDAKISQIVPGLPNGKYLVTATAVQTSEGSYVFANGVKAEATMPASIISLNVEVTDGTLEIGFARENTTSNWVGVDNFRIYCTELNIESLIAAYNEAKTAAETFLSESTSLPYLTQEIVDNINNALEAAELSETPSIAEVTRKTEDIEKAVEQAKVDLEQAHKDYILANPQDGEDLTFAIVNAEINGADGWTIERPNGGNGPLLSGTAFEYWGGNATSRDGASFDYYQVINNLPAGRYTVSAEMYNSLNGEEGAEFNASTGVYAQVGETVAYALCTQEGTTLNPYTTEEITVTDGTLRLGVKSFERMGARWFVADNFKLTYVGAAAVEPLTFTFSQNEDGTVKVTPSDLTRTYGVGVFNKTVAGIFELMGVEAETNEEIFDTLVEFGTVDSDNVAAGERDFDVLDFMEYMGEAELSGEYTILAAECEVEGAYDVVRTGDVSTFTATYEAADLGEFSAEIVLGETALTVTPADQEQLYAVTLIDADTYEAYSSVYSPEAMVAQMTEEAVSGTQSFTYADFDYFQYAGAGKYVVLAAAVAEVDDYEYKSVSNAIVTEVELDAEGKVAGEPVNVLLTKEMFHQWDGFDASATVKSETCYWDAAEYGTELGGGSVVFGSSNVTNTDYADLSAYKTLTVYASTSGPLRIMFNRQADNSLTEVDPVVTAGVPYTLDLTQYEYFHLNAIKVNWGESKITVEKIVLNANEPAVMLDNTMVLEGKKIASASDIKVAFPAGSEFDYVYLDVEKEVWNEPWMEGEEGYYTYESLDLASDEETWSPVCVKNEDGSFSFKFEKQPQAFYENVNYRVKVLAAATNGDAENWYNYDVQRFDLYFEGATEGKEPVEIIMGWPTATQFEGPIDLNTFEGITIEFPMNNLDEALGETEAWQVGAIALQVNEAYIYKMNAMGEPDTENPVASVEGIESDFEATSVSVFTNKKFQAALEPSTEYLISVPGIILVNQMETDENWMPVVLWQASMMEQVVVFFSTDATAGIQNVRVQMNGEMFNLNGQKVNKANGIVIMNGKKVNLK